MYRLLREFVLLICACACFPWGLFGQHAVDPSMRYYRLVCLVHMTGSGKKGDPMRPEYVPMTVDAKRQGIIAWSYVPTDVGHMAIIHIVASNRHAFDAILADKRPEIKVFEPGKVSQLLIEAELKLFKADFDLAKFQVVAQ